MLWILHVQPVSFAFNSLCALSEAISFKDVLHRSPYSVLSRDLSTRHFGRVFCHLDGFGRDGQPLKFSLSPYCNP